jgi:DNA-binding LacI/PurR family transcriptional regulator
MGAKRKKVTLADLAHEAKASVATVSRFMTGSAEVNPEMRVRIIEAAKRLGFDLETGQKSRIMAFILGTRGVMHSFHSSVLMGAEAYCAEHDYGLLFLSLKYSMNTRRGELELPEILQRKGVVSGVIVAGTNSRGLLDILTQHHMPWVTLGNNIIGDLQEDDDRVVYFDDSGGMYDLTRYLQSLGHKRIGFIGNVRLPWYQRRFQGYLRAMNEAGLEALSSDLNTPDPGEMGYLATKLMLQQAPNLTAAIAGDDSIAGGIYKAARDSGLGIPHDLSVAGFNDTIEASFLGPPLTSVRVFPDELGRQLAESLHSKIANPDLPVGAVVLPTQLVRRESCAPIPF